MAAVAAEADAVDAPGVAAAEGADTHDNWRATARFLNYRGLGAAMGHMPLPLAQGVAAAWPGSWRCGAGRRSP